MKKSCELRGCDTMSEKSDGTTGTSVSGRGSAYNGSGDDLQELATLLGLSKMEDLYQERFRVDRRKLERMLKGDDEFNETAEVFFQKIMEETHTRISWPSRLKIGAKSKKDPNIRIAGRNEGVKIAKARIMSVLDTKSNRVIMKLDVSYTDHSHIIGRGGLSIKSVMEDTGCHIHFPDSNRSNPTEKSNQVSIAGELEGVEKARARVRELTPLIFSFESPVVDTLASPPDAASQYIKYVEETYNVQVMFRKRPKLHSLLVLVKGCEWEVEHVKEATQILIAHMCSDTIANQTAIHMMMEISPLHHPTVVGNSGENLKRIIQRTGTQILFPDSNDPSIPSLKKSSITITGSIHNVYLARQQLVGSLPLLLIFDIAEDNFFADLEQINDIMHNLDVHISIRKKQKRSGISITIKGIERNASNIYEARRQILCSKEETVVANIPSTYDAPNSPPTFWGNSGSINFPNVGCRTSPNMFLPPNYQPPPVIMGNGMEQNWLLSQLGSPSNHHLLQTHQQLLLNHLLPRHLRTNGIQHNERSPLGHFSLSLPDIAGGYSTFSTSTSPLSSPCPSPRNSSPIPNCVNGNRKNESNNSLGDKSDCKAPGFERQSRNFMDYQRLKIQAAQAVQNNPLPTHVRVPTANWSGYGFSQSSPSSILKEQKLKDGHHSQNDDVWKDAPTFSASVVDYSSNPDLGTITSDISLPTSNYLDALPVSTLNLFSQYSDLPSVLAALGLEKYTQLFKSHEVDLATLQTLTEADLREIGISAVGARRKMMLYISEMNSSNIFQGSAAPGAERKNSSSTTSLNDNW